MEEEDNVASVLKDTELDDQSDVAAVDQDDNISAVDDGGDNTKPPSLQVALPCIVIPTVDVCVFLYNYRKGAHSWTRNVRNYAARSQS